MTNPTHDARQIGDSFAVALLQWPAAIVAFELGDTGWAFALKIVLATWVALVSLGLIFGRKEGPRWGLSMTFCLACAIALWLTHGTLWSLVWFGLVMISLHAAIRARISEVDAPAPIPEVPVTE